MPAGTEVRRSRPLATILHPGMQVLGIRPDGGIEWENVVALARRTYHGRLLRIVTRGGDTITVTEGHPLLVMSSGRLVVREARDIVRDDLIPILSRYPDANSPSENPFLVLILLLSPAPR